MLYLLYLFSENFTVPLPRLSTFVQENLASGRVLSCFNNLIAECAHFYMDSFPITTSGQYQEVGEQMFRRFPCIKFGKGPEPWVNISNYGLEK